MEDFKLYIVVDHDDTSGPEMVCMSRDRALLANVDTNDFELSNPDYRAKTLGYTCYVVEMRNGIKHEQYEDKDFEIDSEEMAYQQFAGARASGEADDRHVRYESASSRYI